MTQHLRERARVAARDAWDNRVRERASSSPHDHADAIAEAVIDALQQHYLSVFPSDHTFTLTFGGTEVVLNAEEFGALTFLVESRASKVE